MKLEKINNNKITAYFDLNDLENHDIDFQSFMSNSPKSQQFFLDVLDIAKDKFNFNTDNYKILIETLVTDNGSFICNLTRLITDKDNICTDTNIQETISKSSIYAFSSLDDFLNFCTSLKDNLKSNINIFSHFSKLVLFNNTYYLVMQNITLNFDILETFCACISEFGEYISNSKYFNYRLNEYGTSIISENAICNALEFNNY